MNNKKMVFGISIVLLLASVGLLNTGYAFPGFHGNGSDQMCHANPGRAYYNGSIPLVLDGVADEDLWDYATNLKSRMTIPVASLDYGSVHEYISVIFAQNSTHLFTYIEWNDPVITSDGSDVDGFSFCWNINAENFDAQYTGGMDLPVEGQSVDSFTWKVDSSENNSQLPVSDTAETQPIAGNLVDKSFDFDGWHSDTTDDIQVSAVHGNVSAHAQTVYGIEIVRELASGESGDVQMTTSGNYEFTLGIYNGTYGIGHWVSTVQAVYIVGTEGEVGAAIPGYSLAIITGVSIITLVLVIKTKRSRK